MRNLSLVAQTLGRSYWLRGCATSLAMAGAILAATPVVAQQSDELVTAAELLDSVANPINGRAIKYLWTGTGYSVLTSSRLVPGEVEVHAVAADVVVAQSGSAEVRLGGVVEGGRETAVNERRGGTISGGHVRTIKAGDMLWIPAGQPHLMTPIGAEPFRYLVIKIDLPAPEAKK